MSVAPFWEGAASKNRLACRACSHTWGGRLPPLTQIRRGGVEWPAAPGLQGPLRPPRSLGLCAPGVAEVPACLGPRGSLVRFGVWGLGSVVWSALQRLASGVCGLGWGSAARRPWRVACGMRHLASGDVSARGRPGISHPRTACRSRARNVTCPGAPRAVGHPARLPTCILSSRARPGPPHPTPSYARPPKHMIP